MAGAGMARADEQHDVGDEGSLQFGLSRLFLLMTVISGVLGLAVVYPLAFYIVVVSVNYFALLLAVGGAASLLRWTKARSDGVRRRIGRMDLDVLRRTVGEWVVSLLLIVDFVAIAQLYLWFWRGSPGA